MRARVYARVYAIVSACVRARKARYQITRT
jgi:hypothetical protein